MYKHQVSLKVAPWMYIANIFVLLPHKKEILWTVMLVKALTRGLSSFHFTYTLALIRPGFPARGVARRCYFIKRRCLKGCRHQRSWYFPSTRLCHWRLRNASPLCTCSNDCYWYWDTHIEKSFGKKNYLTLKFVLLFIFWTLSIFNHAQ